MPFRVCVCVCVCVCMCVQYYTEADFFLGARITIYSRKFVLVDADEFTIKFMEAHSHEFPFSDPHRVIDKIRARDFAACAAALRQKDAMGRGIIPADAFKEVMIRNNLGINDQEAHSIARFFTESGGVAYERVISAAGSRDTGVADEPAVPATFDGAISSLRSMLYKRGPGGVRGLERAMQHVSRGTGSIDRTDLDTVLGFCGVSMPEELLTAVFSQLDKGDGIIESSELIACLRAPLSRGQEHAVLAVFDSLEDPTYKTGAVEIAEVLKRYKPARHAKVMHGDMSESEAMREIQDAFDGLPDGMLTERDLLSFYSDIVSGYKLTDSQLVELLRATWGLSGRRQ